MTLNIIIPAWNEEDQINSLFTALERVCSELTIRWKIFLVDDGSTDKTVEMAFKFAENIPVTILQHKNNRGVSQAFRTGFDAVLAESEPNDFIVTMEANKNADPEMIPRMLKLAEEGSDLILASCYAPGGAVIGDPFFRLALSKGINFVLRTLFPCNNIHTYTSFYRLWRYELIVAIKEQTNGKYFFREGFVCMADMLLKARLIPAIKIKEIPMVLKSDIRESGSKMKIGQTIRGYLELIFSNLFK